ncbi:tripartite tricarboxylate transporter TctB family protein [Deinococcus wulumuqiensis]|uniref:tripartite tricarboxylate transporter TctB family protein n=1 Tax=Deinococcus wulumuqiensis TaxID=980427 RepID=UPI000348218F|nr:tripartite tricarboxylate transporter TctB family protein [Deinococcus wulumuqiensis]QII22131.1 tripartite tricarboxylate transporter TctB family protein [Deinococcus wulumuqiensis R12]
MTNPPPSSTSPAPPVRGVSVPDLLVALGTVLTGLALLLGAFRIPFGINAVVGPRLFPLLVSVVTLLLGGWLTVGALRGERAEPGAEEDTDPEAAVNLGAPAVVLAGLLLGTLLLEPLGFVFGTALMYFSVTYAFGERRYGRMLAVSLLVALLAYVLFTRGLGLSLPAGLLKGVL